MKIAIVGTAPSSRLLAPIDDPSWEIWVCSRGNTKAFSRVDQFFEMHSLDRVFNDPRHPDYAEYLKGIPTLWMQKKHPDYPNSKTYPKNKMVDEFSPYFFLSSFSYMFAAALTEDPKLFDREEKPTEIGLWGVDLAANSEYQHQRPAAHHFMFEAQKRGVKIRLPIQSDLSRPPPLYGYKETSHMGTKMALREQELRDKLNTATNRSAEATAEIEQLRGALDNMKYISRTWID